MRYGRFFGRISNESVTSSSSSFLRRVWVEEDEGRSVILYGLTAAAMAVAAAYKVPKQAIKSPSMALSYVVAFSSLLTGAAAVHNIFKPDLTIPEWSSQDTDKESGNFST